MIIRSGGGPAWGRGWPQGCPPRPAAGTSQWPRPLRWPSEASEEKASDGARRAAGRSRGGRLQAGDLAGGEGHGVQTEQSLGKSQASVGASRKP